MLCCLNPDCPNPHNPDDNKFCQTCSTPLVALRGHYRVIQLLSGEDSLGTYHFGTGVAAHHFCRVCGINTHHHRSSVPGQVAVSAACLDGVSPFDFLELPVWEGERETPPGQDVLAGVLRYSPA